MPSRKILIVDDSKVATMAAQMMFRQMPDYELITAENGAEGVRKAIEERPDLILMDVVMPVMNGFEACRKIRETEETKSIPIIMVTTRSEASNVDNAFEAGCNDYITKPIGAALLVKKVSELLDD